MPVNNHPDGDDSPLLQPFSPGGRAHPGLLALRRAWSYARDTDLDIWDFALEVSELYGLGLTVSDLRWLVAKSYVEHGNEISVYGDSHRSFEAGSGLNFESRTCLVLTEGGASFTTGFFEDSQAVDSRESALPRIDASEKPGEGRDILPGPAGEMNDSQPTGKPRWHATRRELLFGDVLVKRFRVPARNQEWILEVFEDDGWPEHIDDPLPPSPDICPKARLHDAINRLNRKQVNPVIRFHGNGMGNGLYWVPLIPGADEAS